MTSDAHSLAHQETELKLIVVCESPRSIYEDIGNIAAIAGFTLEAQPDQIIEIVILTRPKVI